MPCRRHVASPGQPGSRPRSRASRVADVPTDQPACHARATRLSAGTAPSPPRGTRRRTRRTAAAAGWAGVVLVECQTVDWSKATFHCPTNCLSTVAWHLSRHTHWHTAVRAATRGHREDIIIGRVLGCLDFFVKDNLTPITFFPIGWGKGLILSLFIRKGIRMCQVITDQIARLQWNAKC